MSYFVLMHSRTWGTEAFPCDDLDEAVSTLAQLARWAEEERQKDCLQRYFCLTDGEAAPTCLPAVPVPDRSLLLHARGDLPCANNVPVPASANLPNADPLSVTAHPDDGSPFPSEEAVHCPSARTCRDSPHGYVQRAAGMLESEVQR